MVDLAGTVPEEVVDTSKIIVLEDKYKMTKEENLKLFVQDKDDFIFNAAKIENSDLSLLQTKDVINGKNVTGVELEDTITVNNLSKAFDYLVDHIDEDLSLDLGSSINEIIVKNALIYRATSKKSKESYGFEAQPWCLSPGIEDKVTNFISELKHLPSVTDQAITLFIYLLKTRFFESGNKRTGLLLANQLMINYGVGYLSIPYTHLQDFKKQVTNYRDNEEIQPLKQFLYDYCIFGK